MDSSYYGLFPPLRDIWLYFHPKGLFGLFLVCLKGCLVRFMAILWPICGQFCGLMYECLSHVQKMVLGAVWLYFFALNDYLAGF